MTKQHAKRGLSLIRTSDTRDACAWRISDIVAAVAVASGGRVSASAITSGVRKSEVVSARWAAIVLARQAGYSLPSISRGVGVDHTSALNALRHIVGAYAHNHPRYDEAARMMVKARAVLAEAQRAFDAALEAAARANDTAYPTLTPAPVPRPAPPVEEEHERPPAVRSASSRAGFVNKRGEIIVGAPRNEAR